MKSVIIASVLGIVMILGGILCNGKTEQISSFLTEEIETVMALAENGDFKSAKDKTEKIQKYIEGKTAHLAATGNHEETDRIELELSVLSEYLEREEETEALAHCGALRVLFKNLPRNYRVKPENVL